MPDAFVTLISVQPAVAVRCTNKMPQQNRPQASGSTYSGLYETIRQKQTVRVKISRPGAT